MKRNPRQSQAIHSKPEHGVESWQRERGPRETRNLRRDETHPRISRAITVESERCDTRQARVFGFGNFLDGTRIEQPPFKDQSSIVGSRVAARFEPARLLAAAASYKHDDLDTPLTTRSVRRGIADITVAPRHFSVLTCVYPHLSHL